MDYRNNTSSAMNLVKTLKATGICANLDEAMNRANEMLGAKDSVQGPAPSFSNSQPMLQKVKLRNGKSFELFSSSEPVHTQPQQIPQEHHELKMEPQLEIFKSVPEPQLSGEPIQPLTMAAKKMDEPVISQIESQSLENKESLLSANEPNEEKPLIDDDFKKLFTK